MILVVQSFGKESEYRRAILTVLSYYACSSPQNTGQTFLFTDSLAYFEPFLKGFPIRFFLLTPEKIKHMRGNIDFLHRMKIALIEESFQCCNETLLYADSDTFFIQDPSSLEKKTSLQQAFMHLCEYRFDSLLEMTMPAGAPFHAFVKCIDENKFLMPDGSALKVGLDQYSWNAGVMVLDHSVMRLLPRVYALTDYFFTATQNHASEQYAFSVVLQNNMTIQSCETYSYHYWYRTKKQIMDLFLEKRLKAKWSQLSPEYKKSQILAWTKILPSYFDRHVLMLRDRAIQAFHRDEFVQGFKFAVKALVKDPIDFMFIKDILYHFKRWMMKSKSQ